MQEVPATFSFLASLRVAGIVVPQGVVIGDRDITPVTVHGAPAVPAQHEQLQEPLRGGRPPQAATAHSAPARQEQDAQPSPYCALVGSRRLMVSFLDLLWGITS